MRWAALQVVHYGDNGGGNILPTYDWRALTFGNLIVTRSCPFLTPAKLVTIRNYVSEKNALTCVESNMIAVDHGIIENIPNLTRYSVGEERRGNNSSAST